MLLIHIQKSSTLTNIQNISTEPLIISKHYKITLLFIYKHIIYSFIKYHSYNLIFEGTIDISEKYSIK